MGCIFLGSVGCRPLLSANSIIIKFSISPSLSPTSSIFYHSTRFIPTRVGYGRKPKGGGGSQGESANCTQAAPEVRYRPVSLVLCGNGSTGSAQFFFQNCELIKDRLCSSQSHKTSNVFKAPILFASCFRLHPFNNIFLPTLFPLSVGKTASSNDLLLL